jgi:tRNA dimethylallyltransferase
MCIVGPTAAGKSALAMALAEQRGLAIVSADSRQIYRRFDIGTAKPSDEELQRVPHFGVNIIDPVERYSAHRWASEAADWCDAANAAGTPPVIVGGTGLYVRALVEPFDAVPDLDPQQRQPLAEWLDALDREELVRWCRRLDPERAHLGRTQLLRAIETALLSGRRLSEHFTDRAGAQGEVATASDGAAHEARYLVVDPGPVLADRIAARVHQMVGHGFFDEVAMLRDTVPAEAPAWNACGYRAMREALEDTKARAAAVERTVIESRQYAKRQRTWFRHQLPPNAVTHIDPRHPGAVQQVLDWWDSASPDAHAQASHTGAAMRAADEEHT